MILKKQGMIFISFPVNQNRWSENDPTRVKFQKFSWLEEGHIPSPKTSSLRRLGPSALGLLAEKFLTRAKKSLLNLRIPARGLCSDADSDKTHVEIPL